MLSSFPSHLPKLAPSIQTVSPSSLIQHILMKWQRDMYTSPPYGTSRPLRSYPKKTKIISMPLKRNKYAIWLKTKFSNPSLNQIYSKSSKFTSFHGFYKWSTTAGQTESSSPLTPGYFSKHVNTSLLCFFCNSQAISMSTSSTILLVLLRFWTL